MTGRKLCKCAADSRPLQHALTHVISPFVCCCYIHCRVLKYNPAKNRIHWESSKMLGGEYIDCSKLVRVSREEAVTYVWHTSGPAGSRKMVGLETQREYDARVLELALLHMLNKPKAV